MTIAPLLFATTYTAKDLVKIIGALGILFGIIGGIVTNILVALRTGRKVDDNTKVTTEGIAKVSEQAAVINGHVNSQASSAAAEIAGLRERVELMHNLSTQSQGVNVQLAAANAAPTPVAVIPAVEAERKVRETDKVKDGNQ